MKHKVFVASCSGIGSELEDKMLASIDLINMKEDLVSAKTIFIKPNLTYPEYKRGVTTRKCFVEALIKGCLTINSNLKIYVGEGEGGYNSFSMCKTFENMGFNELEKKYSQVTIINLSKMPSIKVDIDTPKGIYSIALPEIFFNEIDFSITCPVPKVHCMTNITLSHKNQWGCVPDTMRLKNHYMFDYIISKICNVLKFKYSFLDGKYGLDDNGPMMGEPVEVNWFVASNSLGAFDVVVAEMMGWDWMKVRHLKIASKYGFIPKKEEIEIIGNIDILKKKFVLKRNFWNYPALAAFRSKSLTNLFYFSRWAKLLHNIMYSFRKRPIT